MNSLAETPYRFDPCLLEQIGPELADTIADLSTESERLGNRLHPRTAETLAVDRRRGLTPFGSQP